MHIDDIKRGLRAEIKKRENEQYATFQCNVRQMCKDVLVKLEELESEIADKDEQLRHSNYKRCLVMARCCNRMFSSTFGKERYWQKWNRRWLELAEKFKPSKEVK